MSRVRPEPVDVWLRDGKPARFIWRGRLYTVLATFDHWSTSREWSHQQDAAMPDAATPDPAVPDPAVLDPVVLDPAVPDPAGPDPAGPDPAGPDPAGPDPAGPVRSEFWRVEASPGKNVPAAVYELRHDHRADRWLLSRSWD